jgi:hypothetical protein
LLYGLHAFYQLWYENKPILFFSFLHLLASFVVGHERTNISGVGGGSFFLLHKIFLEKKKQH